jgi:hypothetical protein
VWVALLLLRVVGAGGGGCFRSNMFETSVRLRLFTSAFSHANTELVACMQPIELHEAP